jgi:hypothetical protein
MNNSLVVGVLERAQQAHEDLKPNLDGIARVIVRISVGQLVDNVLQRLAINVLHDEVIGDALAATA